MNNLSLGQKRQLAAILVAIGLLSMFLVVRLSTKRDEKPTTLPVIGRSELYSQSGQRAGVEYHDRRKSGVTVYYMDVDFDGRPESVIYYDREGKARTTFRISLDESVAEYGNMQNLKAATPLTLEDPRIFVWVKSGEGQKIVSNYRDVITAYRQLHPEEELRESNPELEPIQPQKIQNFSRLVDEYLARRREVQRAGSGKAAEIAAYRQYLAEEHMAVAYGLLTRRDREALFEWDSRTGEKALEVGKKIGLVLTWDKPVWSYWPRNPQRSFEEYLRSEQEIDSMSVWSIAGELEKHKANYLQELEKRGLIP